MRRDESTNGESRARSRLRRSYSRSNVDSTTVPPRRRASRAAVRSVIEPSDAGFSFRVLAVAVLAVVLAGSSRFRCLGGGAPELPARRERDAARRRSRSCVCEREHARARARACVHAWRGDVCVWCARVSDRRGPRPCMRARPRAGGSHTTSSVQQVSGGDGNGVGRRDSAVLHGAHCAHGAAEAVRLTGLLDSAVNGIGAHGIVIVNIVVVAVTTTC